MTKTQVEFERQLAAEIALPPLVQEATLLAPNDDGDVFPAQQHETLLQELQLQVGESEPEIKNGEEEIVRIGTLEPLIDRLPLANQEGPPSIATDLFEVTMPNSLAEFETFVAPFVLESEMLSVTEQQAAANEAEPMAVEIDWHMALDEEPLQLYEDFTEALQQFAETIISNPLISEADQQSVIETEDEQSVGPEPVPPILLLVIDKLNTLDPTEKEAVGLTLKDIVASTIKIKEAGPDEALSMKEDLKKLCRALFEELGNDSYSEEELEQFVALLLQPAFRPIQPLELAIDPEYDGMHEVKRHFLQFSDDAHEDRGRLSFVIGHLCTYFELRFGSVRV
jgi:hypothetical protein